RVEGATKYLKVPLLITGSTAAQLSPEFPRRKLCEVRVVNIPQSVALYELMTATDPPSAQLGAEYEEALSRFEQREFRASLVSLARILSHHENDGPSQVLLSRVSNAVVEGPLPEHPVWELPGK